MDYNAIRNKLGPMTRGQVVTFNTPELRIEVQFREDGVFVVIRDTRTGATDISKFTSLRDTVNHVLKDFTPRKGQIYQHINSNIYTIIAIANEHSLRPEYPPSVVYQGENGLVWCKPLENFQRKMTRIK